METAMDKVRAMLRRVGLPEGNLYDLPSSGATFPDGGHYRNEVSGVASLAKIEMLANEMAKRNIVIHRAVWGGKGADSMTMSDLRALARIAHDAKIEVVIDPGVSSNFDVGRHVQTDHGKISGWRPRGADNLAYLTASVQRCLEAGIRGFLLWGEDLLFMLNKMRQNGDLPADTIFKVSYTAGHANPAGAMLLQMLGADSFNPVTDLELPMLAAMRSVVTIPMDIAVCGWPTLGGFKRFWQAAEFVRTCSPCYLKQESWEEPESKVKTCEIIAELIERQCPGLKLSPRGSDDLRIPRIV